MTKAQINVITTKNMKKKKDVKTMQRNLNEQKIRKEGEVAKYKEMNVCCQEKMI